MRLNIAVVLIGSCNLFNGIVSDLVYYKDKALAVAPNWLGGMYDRHEMHHSPELANDSSRKAAAKWTMC